MKKWFKNNLLTCIGILVGALAGFMYWNFVGCQSGTCAITSNPFNSTIYGMLMGGLLFSTFQKTKTNESV